MYSYGSFDVTPCIFLFVEFGKIEFCDDTISPVNIHDVKE